MDYIVLFDVATKPRPWFTIGPMVIGAALAYIVGRFGGRTYSERERWSNLFLSRVFVALMAFALILSSYIYERDRQAMITDLAHGDVQVVEGVISGIVKKKPLQNGPECFTVQSKTFCYSSNKMTPTFNDYSAPIRKGLWIRVTHRADSILRLETTRSALDRATANIPRK